ncbi:hypothetical protein HDU76_013743 [Blyttiomyces sp. JEL0837]|nr:hypothetical protein HDU76_013743 [Blyttiomyces sp. JEL0837]
MADSKNKDSLQTTVADLAADGKQIKESKLPAIPVSMVVLMLVISALAIVVIPLGVIITDSSKDSISDLSRIIMNQAVDGMVTQIQEVLGEPAKLLNIVTKNKQVITTLTTNKDNFKKDVDTWIFLEQLMNSSSYVSGINCITYPGLFATNPPSVPWPNITMFTAYRDPDKVILYYVDFSTNAYSMAGVYVPEMQAWVADYPLYNFENVFLMDSVNGILLSDSVKYSTYVITNYSDPSLPVLPYTPSTTNDSYARDLGLFLRDRFGGYDKIPNEQRTVTIEAKIGSTQWIINYRFLDNPTSWIVVVGIPRSDFFSKSDNAQKKAAILAAVLAVIGVVATTVTAWLAMRPLHTLTLAMEKLTKMDFSALEGDILSDRSFMLELRRLQVTFSL